MRTGVYRGPRVAEKEKTVSVINRKIREGKAVVLSASEFAETMRSGQKPDFSEIDVVTLAWNSPISGTAVMLCVPVAERGVFTRARSISLNGVPGVPGPAPNERLGVVDAQIFAVQSSCDQKRDYKGARLFVDIMRKERIEVECVSESRDTFRNTFTIDDVQFARMYIYNSFFDRPVASGGQRNRVCAIPAGSKILLNRAPGIVIGSGAWSSPGKRALSLSAELFRMDPELMTTGNPKAGITNSIAIAIPVVNQECLKDLAEWSLAGTPSEQADDSRGTERDMSCYVKDLILKGNFFLTDCSFNNPGRDRAVLARPGKKQRK